MIVTVEPLPNVVQVIACKAAVLKVRWTPICAVNVAKVLQNPKICSSGNCPFYRLFASTAWSFICICFNDGMGIPSSVSFILSK